MAFDFEKSLDRLKIIVSTMENEDANLEKSLDLYSEGIKLYKQCNDFLEKASRKVELLKNGKEIAEKPTKKAEISLFEENESE